VIRRVVIRPEAERDINLAADWYEERKPGLGGEFIGAVVVVLDNIEQHPRSHPIVRGRVRRALLLRFPYGVFYAEENGVVVVLACLHARRSPRRWPS
jgi:plasmid stabilization system protein ParE